MNPNKACQICSKTANGMHFGALTCRACAAFFRRAVVLKLQYTCKTGKEGCELDGKSRSLCRFCRLEKCKNIGMNAERVILDYDPTVSQKAPEPEPEEESDEEVLPESTKASQDLTANPKPRPNFPFNLKIDFTELVLKVEEIFQTPEKSDKNDLECLTDGLKKFRENQLPKTEILFLGKANLDRVETWLNVRIRKNAIWFSNCKYLMEKLPMDQKMQLYKTSWNVFRMFERISQTLNVYGQEALDRNFILVSDDYAMVIDKSLISFSAITNFTDGYFNQLFHPFLNKYMEEVAKPMYELELTEEEVVFCMVHILGVDATGFTPETIEVLQKFKEIISDQMHFYYTNHTNHRMYSHRIAKMMQLVRTMKKIAREKTKIKELFWVFDVFKADISEPYFFQLF